MCEKKKREKGRKGQRSGQMKERRRKDGKDGVVRKDMRKEEEERMREVGGR